MRTAGFGLVLCAVWGFTCCMGHTWQRGLVLDSEGVERRCIEPVVVSASRSTDIPAFYSEWFANRLAAGFCQWRNPFNGRSQYVSFRQTRLFVFWTKHAAPFMPLLDTLDDRGVHYYFLYTLNHYASEQLEPGMPSLAERLGAFKALSERLGPERVIWRFDPLVITPSLPPEALLARVTELGRALQGYTRRLIISFVDIARYRSVQRNLEAAGVAAGEFTERQMRAFCRELVACASGWGMEVHACAEEVDLSGDGVVASSCIDPDLALQLWPDDIQLRAFLDGLGKRRKDPGQRLACRCMPAKDIGHYNTCRFGCAYCYACHAPSLITRNARIHDPEGEGLCSPGG